MFSRFRHHSAPAAPAPAKASALARPFTRREARLARCANHPRGGCSVARHGTYACKTPAGTQVARWYCRESHTTFSLLPDCLAARLPGTLTESEKVVVEAEQADSLMTVADRVRSDAIELPGAMRWVRQRVLVVHHALSLVIGLLPNKLSGCRPEITACRERLGSDAVLVSLRSLTDRWLPVVAAPLGFRPHGIGGDHPPNQGVSWQRHVNAMPVNLTMRSCSGALDLPEDCPDAGSAQARQCDAGDVRRYRHRHRLGHRPGSHQTRRPKAA